MIGPGDATGLDGAVGPNPSTELQTWSWWGGSSPPSTATMATSTMSAIGALPTQLHGVLSSALDVSDPDAIVNGTKGMPSLGHIGGESMGRLRMSGAANEYMAFILVTVGAFLLIGGCLNYWRAVRRVLSLTLYDISRLMTICCIVDGPVRSKLEWEEERTKNNESSNSRSSPLSRLAVFLAIVFVLSRWSIVSISRCLCRYFRILLQIASPLYRIM